MTDRRKWKIIISLLWVALAFLIIGILLAIRWYNSNLQPADSQQTLKQRFEIARGATMDEVARNLESQGLIKDAAVFKWHLRFNGLDSNIQAGVLSSVRPTTLRRLPKSSTAPPWPTWKSPSIPANASTK